MVIYSWIHVAANGIFPFFSMTGNQFSSVQLLSHVRFLATPWAAATPSSLSWQCHPTISSSVIPFFHLQSFPASGSFPISQFFAWGGQNIGVSPSTSVLPMNTQNWSLGCTGGTPYSPRDPQESSPTPQFKSILRHSAFFTVQLSHPYMTTGKTIALTRRTFVSKVMSAFEYAI